MALLNFNYGLLEHLSNQSIVNGNVYITTDEPGFYVDLDGARIHVSDFVQVATAAELEALGTYTTHAFYYVAESNALMKYLGAGVEQPWKQLNSTSALSSEIDTLKEKVSALETKDNQLAQAIEDIDASKVDTTKTIKVTTTVGNYTKGQEIDVTNLQSFLEGLLSQDSNPTKTAPYVSVTLTNAGAKEAGTEFTPSYSVSTNPGKYTANGVEQASGVTFSAYSVTERNRPDDIVEATKTTSTGDFDSFVVTDTTNYDIAAYATHSAGNMPTTYLGKDYPSVQITAGNTETKDSSNVTSYRPIFYGMTTSDATIDSAFIRGLTKISEAPKARTISFTAANLPGVKKFIVAIPTKSANANINLNVTKAIITTSMNADATSNYVKQSTNVDVTGAGTYTTTVPYKVWIYEPAEIASTEVHSVTIG